MTWLVWELAGAKWSTKYLNIRVYTQGAGYNLTYGNGNAGDYHFGGGEGIGAGRYPYHEIYFN